MQLLSGGASLAYTCVVCMLQFIDMLVEELKGALVLKQFEKARKLVSYSTVSLLKIALFSWLR